MANTTKKNAAKKPDCVKSTVSIPRAKSIRAKDYANRKGISLQELLLRGLDLAIRA